MLNRFSRIGISPGSAFDPEALDADLRTALRSGVESARNKIAARVETIAEAVNGWKDTDALGSR